MQPLCLRLVFRQPLPSGGPLSESKSNGQIEFKFPNFPGCFSAKLVISLSPRDSKQIPSHL